MKKVVLIVLLSSPLSIVCTASIYQYFVLPKSVDHVRGMHITSKMMSIDIYLKHIHEDKIPELERILKWDMACSMDEVEGLPNLVTEGMEAKYKLLVGNITCESP